MEGGTQIAWFARSAVASDMECARCAIVHNRAKGSGRAAGAVKRGSTSDQREKVSMNWRLGIGSVDRDRIAIAAGGLRGACTAGDRERDAGPRPVYALRGRRALSSL